MSFEDTDAPRLAPHTEVPASNQVSHVVEAYLVNKNKQRPQPTSYPFERSDWKSPKEPPSPCRACGGPHWNADCKHYDKYLALKKSSPALLTEVEPSPDEDMLYTIAYLSNTMGSSYAVVTREVQALVEGVTSPRKKSNLSLPVSIEEMPDESIELEASRPKLPTDSRFIMEDELPDDSPPSQAKTANRTPAASAPTTSADVPSAQEEELVDVAVPPASPTEYFVRPVRKAPAGLSSVGITILSVTGVVGSKQDAVITLRLDSGASISLIAEEFLKSLKNPPKIRTGLKVHLAQLTNKDPSIKGYVELPIWVKAEDGTALKFLVEMYVVPGMTVEVLLGEDFHVNHELNVLRNVELGTRVSVGQTGFGFTAASTTRDKANILRRKKAHANGAITAWQDTLIPAETTVRVPIAGALQPGREWYVERYLIPQSDETFLTVPNTLLDLRTEDAGRAESDSIARKSYVAVANPSKTPRLVRAGTLLGYAKDPALYLDRPRTQEKLNEM
ncbi:hypothetical protein EXIGLDRAFT_609164, partial [Exidia glandulosa HHB12029]